MNESIYALIPPTYEPQVHGKMYRSKYDPKAPLTSSTFGLHGTTATIGGGIEDLKKSHVLSSTFGPPSSTSPTGPSNYLKSTRTNLNTTNLTNPPSPQKSFTRHTSSNATTNKPQVPLRNEQPVYGLRTSKNFVTSNAVEAILSVPLQTVVNRRDVNYLTKVGYGEVPSYLGDVKSEVEREEDMIEEYIKLQLNKESLENNEIHYRPMSHDERSELVSKLKTKWDALNHTYQKICHRVKFEGRGDIGRKEDQERELIRIEGDIMKLESGGEIMIEE